MSGTATTNSYVALLFLSFPPPLLLQPDSQSNDAGDDASSDGPKYAVTCALPDEEPEQSGCLFIPNIEMPEQPSRGFFKGLFSGAPSSLDREELCTLLVTACLASC